MLFYAIRRTIGAVLMLVVMSMVTFAIFFLTPTDPARLTCGKNCTPQGISTNRHYLGWDKPIYTQYSEFVKGLFVGRDFPDNAALKKANPSAITHCAAPCLGYSPLRNSLIWTYLKPRIPVTIFLSLAAFVMWIVGGVLLGILAALAPRQGRRPRRRVRRAAVLLVPDVLHRAAALPGDRVPAEPDADTRPTCRPPQSLGSFAYNIFLPAFTLAAIYAAAYIRITRTYMLETMSEDYLRTARAKGLKSRRIVFKHTLRAALTPIVTLAGLDLGALLAGAPITETIFGYQGVGNAAVLAATQFDLPMTVIIVLLSAAFVIFANLVVDLLYGVIDPRVRF